MVIALLLSAPLCLGAGTQLSARAVRHWDNWIYSKEAHHWHSLWCRWRPSGELIHACHAERIFEPTDDGNRQKNIYHFEDERGTISEGRMSGPWFMNQEMSTDVGVVHPYAPTHTTLLLPGGPCVWANMDMSIESGAPLRCELFLHPTAHLRMSASVVYSAEGELTEFVLWREDDRGPWPSAGWSASREAREVSPEELRAELAQYEGAKGSGDAMSATLEPESLQAVPFGTCRAVSASAEKDAILLCADGAVAIIAPKRLPSAPFSICAVWSADAGACTIEALWDGAKKLKSVSHVRFAAPQ